MLCDSASFGASAGDSLEPVGVWACLIYGHTRLGDERLLLRLSRDGSTDMAKPRADGFRIWIPMSDWNVARERLSFKDPRMGREFVGDLKRRTLGGTWNTTSMQGGWWCAPIAYDPDDTSHVLERYEAVDLMPTLMPKLMSAPRYPRQAIREAKEGRTVACFLVDANGVVHEPTILEISDEVFREETLRALLASRYQSRSERTMFRPGCRSFNFELHAVY